MNRRINSDYFCSELRSISLASPNTLLPAGAFIAAALLTATALSLISLTNAATVGLVRLLIDLAHVVAILNHVLAAETAVAILNL